MSIRQTLSPWLVAAALLTCVATGQLACRLLSPPDFEPQTIGELRQRLEQSDLGLHLVPTADTTEEAGVYLCTTPQPRDELLRLMRMAECAHRWKGVVFCSHEGSMARVPESIVRSWGEHGMRLGDLLFFGDPALLARIRGVMIDGRRGGPRPAAPHELPSLV
jgi:hypothetical protein